MDEKLIGMGLVEEVIQSVLHTAYIQHSIPLSLLLVAPSGTGKSKSIKQFVSDGIHVQNDLTTFDLNRICESDKDDLVHHIIIPDLNLPLSHRSSVAKLMIATLLGTTSERTKIHISRKDGEHVVTHRSMGLISSITPTIFWKNARKFSELGFVRRMPSIFFEQSETTVELILDSIEKDKISFLQLQETRVAQNGNGSIPMQSVEIPRRFNKDIRNCSKIFTLHLNLVIQKPYFFRDKSVPSKEKSLTPISPSLYLRSLLRGHALLRKRKEVINSDIEFLSKFLTLTDCNNPRAL